MRDAARARPLAPSSAMWPASMGSQVRPSDARSAITPPRRRLLPRTLRPITRQPQAALQRRRNDECGAVLAYQPANVVEATRRYRSMERGDLDGIAALVRAAG